MELSQQKKQIIFKTCFVILILSIVAFLCCKLFESFHAIDVYKKTLTLLNGDVSMEETFNAHKNWLSITIIETLKIFILIFIILSLLVHLKSNLKNKKLFLYIQLTTIISTSLILNIVSYIIKNINSYIIPAAYSGQLLITPIIIMFIILIVSLIILIPQIIKEIKLLKNKPSSDPTCES